MSYQQWQNAVQPFQINLYYQTSNASRTLTLYDMHLKMKTTNDPYLGNFAKHTGMLWEEPIWEVAHVNMSFSYCFLKRMCSFFVLKGIV